MMVSGLMIRKMVKVVILILLPMKSMMVGGWMVRNMDLVHMCMHLEINIQVSGRMEKSMVKDKLNIRMAVN